MNYNDARELCNALNTSWRESTGGITLDSSFIVPLLRELKARFPDLEWDYRHHYGLSVMGQVLSPAEFQRRQNTLAELKQANRHFTELNQRLDLVLVLMHRLLYAAQGEDEIG